MSPTAVPRKEHLRDSAGFASPWPHVRGSGTGDPVPGMQRVGSGDRAAALESDFISHPATPTRRPLPPQSDPTHLGTPGGARLGREGTWGGGPKGSGEAPGLEGTGAPPPGRTQQAEAQEQGPATRAGLGARRGLGAAAWGWTWAICGRQGQKNPR